MEELNNVIAKNIALLRVENKMTQGELADKLNYTDKSVSKWERGESIPPVDILKNIADIFGVSLDYLVSSDHDEKYDKLYTAKENTPNKIIITLLAVSLVWLTATILFVYGMVLSPSHVANWLLFVYAVPLSIIVLIIFNGIWGKRKYMFVLISLEIWTLFTAIYLFFINKINLWAIFILGVPLQIAIILWSQLKTNKKRIK